MKSFLKKMAPGFIGSLIIFIIGLYVKDNSEKRSNQKRHIDCYEEVAFNGIDSAELNEQGIQILHNGRAMFGFSEIDVELYNFSDKDGEDIRVIIEITPEEDDSLEMAGAKVFGPHNLTTGFTKIRDNTEKAKKGSFVLEYLIETANRADSLKDAIFDLNYGVISKEEPTLKVIIQGVGFTKENYNRDHYKKLTWWERDDNAFLCFFFAGLILFLLTFFKTLLYMEKKRNERWGAYLFENLTERISNGKINYDAQGIINIYNHLSERFYYEDTSIIMRRIKKMKPPSDL